MSNASETVKTLEAADLFAALLGNAPELVFLEIRSVPPTRYVRQRFYDMRSLQERSFRMADLNQLDGTANIYYGVVPRVEGRGTSGACAAAMSVWADFDTGAPTSLPLPPCVVVQTSPGKFQALWLLEEPCGDLQCVEALNKAIAFNHGGDLNSCDRARVLRLPGFLNLKYPTRPRSRLLVCRPEVRYTMLQLEDAFPTQKPSFKLSKPPIVGGGRAPRWLWLVYEAIVDYLSDTGFAPRAVGQDRTMARCPLHHDKIPSLSLHATRGWKCFAGCGEGRLTLLAARLGISITERL